MTAGHPIKGTVAIKRAAGQNKARIWKDVLERLGSHTEINLKKLSNVTKKGDVLVVPGKVLGGGVIDHAVTVGASAFSRSALVKIAKAGGKSLPIERLIELYPDGKGVRIVVG